MEYILSKPSSLKGYGLHQLVVGLTNGVKVIFNDENTQVRLRTDCDLSIENVSPIHFKENDVKAFELNACTGTKVKGHHRYFNKFDYRGREAWLRRQGEMHGFKILTVVSFADKMIIKDDKREFSVDDTRFVGVLKIVDLPLFENAYKNGIGKCKTFGFGMFLL